MDPTATPWRVLEDSPDRVATAPVTAVAPTSAGPALVISRSALAIVGAAAGLAVLAFLLAFGTAGDGVVVLDGGSPIGSAGVTDELLGVADPGGRASAVAGGQGLIAEIVGAVERPGVFRLPAGARVGDLVEAAGGYGARVDIERASRELNLAAALNDGDHVRVPSRDDVAVDGPASRSAEPWVAGVPDASAGGPLDLNRATAVELEALPGIGPVTAGKIMTSREEAPFRDVGDLRTRKLVGEKTFEKLRDLVTVR
jgi:competence protein ComEA